MKLELLFYVYLVLYLTVFLDILFTFRKNHVLKILFLLMISSLFVINYFDYAGVDSRLQFILVKSMRVVYVSSTMLAIIRLSSTKIPRWIIAFIILSVFFVTGVRIFHFSQINMESQSALSNQLFSVGTELYTPNVTARYIVFAVVLVTIAVTYYYYRLFLMRINRETVHYKYLSRWMISLVLPFFLLTIFGVLGNLNLFQESACSYLCYFFNGIILLSILFRPRFLNTVSYAEINK